MENPMQSDHALAVVIATVTVMVFLLDLLTPPVVAIWTLYILPLGLTRWSSITGLTFLVAGALSVLILVGHLYSPTGASKEIAQLNCVMAMIMVWFAAFFLKFGKG